MMYGIITFTPKARMAAYDGTNKEFIAKAVAELFNGSINDSMSGSDGALLVILPGGATHVLHVGYSVVEFLGELRVVQTSRIQVV